MILGVGQLREARAHKAPGDLAVPGDDVTPLVDWDLGGMDDLGLPLAAQLARAGSSEIADPVGLAIRGNQIAAPADLDGNDRHLAGSPVRRPTTVRVATPRAPSRIASGLAKCLVKAGGFRYAMVILSSDESAH